MNFSLLVENDDAVRDYLLANQKRFNDEKTNIVFIGKFKQSTIETNDTSVLNMLVNVSLEIMMPPIYIVGFIILFLGLIFSQPVIMIIGAVMSMSSIFWSIEFQRFVFKKGLRKAGYEGIIRNVTNSEALEMVIYESDGIIRLV